MSPARAETALVVGGGIFGTTAALELRRRGLDVVLLDSGEIPHPLAASTDISKVVRMEYGADVEYMELGERAREGWIDWNTRMEADGQQPVYHETGVAMFCMDPMVKGGFEYESFAALKKRGHSPHRIVGTDLLERFPAWNRDLFVDGFYHSKGGYAESGRTIEILVAWLRIDGVQVVEGAPVVRIDTRHGRATGATCKDGRRFSADHIIVAAGAWTSKLVPELRDSIRPTGHPVFHLRPQQPALFEQDRFPTFTADVARTGYYGFPLNRDGVVKIGVHALGRSVDADDQREVAESQVIDLREFLKGAFPTLADSPIVYTRLCLYADTLDEHFWIDRHPTLAGLTVASGGSGHGFKFAPVLGSLIADALEGVAFPSAAKFAWRVGLELETGQEAARCHLLGDR